MLNEFRSTSITWDKATRRIYSPVTANESDENGRKLVVQIINGGEVEDLTGAALHLYWETRDKLHNGLDVFKAVDLKKGEFELSYTTGMLSNQGVLNANLVLIDSVGRVVSDRFKITVTEGIDNDAIQSENSFSSLTQALIDISDLEQNYAPRLNDLTAQLQQTEQSLSSQLAQSTQQINNNKSNIDIHSSQIASLSSGSPEAVSLISQMIDTAKNYVYTGVEAGYVSGNWYYNDGTVWRSGGVYQSAGIADKTVTLDKTTFIQTSTNLFDKNDVITGYAIDATTGELVPNPVYSVTPFKKIESSTQYTFVKTNDLVARYVFYDASKQEIVSDIIGTLITVETITTPANAEFYRLVVANTHLDIFQMNKGNVALPYESYFKPTLDKKIKLPIETENLSLVYSDGILTSVIGSDTEYTINYNVDGSILNVVESANGESVETTLNYTNGILTAVNRNEL